MGSELSLEEQLRQACSKGESQVIQELLKQDDIDVNEKNSEGRGALDLACRFGHLECVQLLVKDKRVDVNQPNHFGGTPFLISCQEGHLDIVQYLYKQKVKLDGKNDAATPLFQACFRGHTEVVMFLMDKIDVNQKDARNCTPFFCACFYGHPEIVKLLLTSDTQVDLESKWKNNNLTALEQAKLHVQHDPFVYNWETEIEGQKRQKNCQEIVEIIKNFERDPTYYKFLWKKEFGILERISSDLMAAIVLVSDDFFTLKIQN